jgi:hypothetical protein
VSGRVRTLLGYVAFIALILVVVNFWEMLVVWLGLSEWEALVVALGFAAVASVADSCSTLAAHGLAPARRTEATYR